MPTVHGKLVLGLHHTYTSHSPSYSLSSSTLSTSPTERKRRQHRMGSRVNICSVDILDNPATFRSEFKLEITFEMFESLPHDLDWELVYVGDSGSREFDQVLDSVSVGPLPQGRHKFVFTAESPNVEKIPESEIVGVTVLLLKCSYNSQEFISLGWFVSNEYSNPELKENPPAVPQIDKLTRTVLTDDLRITTYAIKWDDNEADLYPPEQEESALDDVVELADLGKGDEEEEESDESEEEEGKEKNIQKSMDLGAEESGMEVDEVAESVRKVEDHPKETTGCVPEPLSEITNG